MSLGIPLPPQISGPVSPILPVSSSSSDSSSPFPTLVLISKDLSDEDLAVFREFGSVVIWKESHINLPFSQLQSCDYLIVDLRLKSARLSLGKENLKQYNVVNYVSWLQKAEDFIEQVGGNTITSIPQQAVNKSDFDNQLNNPKIISPSLIKSFFRLVVGCWKK